MMGLRFEVFDVVTFAVGDRSKMVTIRLAISSGDRPS